MTTTHDPTFDHEDAERLLTALEGIVSAHIVTDPVGRMVEIHILATSELHPKQVVRNVESALSAGLGIEVDRRIVSVAQIRSESNGRAAAGDGDRASPEGSRAAPSPRSTPPLASVPEEGPGEEEPASADPAGSRAAASGRLEYVRYESRRADERCTCSVVLRADATEIVGRGEGPDTVRGRAEAAARAVLEAVSRARGGVELRLEGATVTDTRGRRFVIVSAHGLLDRGSVQLAGAAALSRSPEEAAILASLQASNRWGD